MTHRDLSTDQKPAETGGQSCRGRLELEPAIGGSFRAGGKKEREGGTVKPRHFEGPTQ